ncbi:carbonic anhydrase [Prochlorothrix hollandica]|uniref:carbonic anhydrase n=1 Tax=Prochlorothrix hollandica PCC 9006 = CALU 1027 TaxID=317619 RepID=A0A0M2PZ81_PROHO|nr:carbonic anhydrase family protein [Prochlorothrix hollandica]KKJ00363.1 carbonate dehydratase [Prochlorothrix hollandica PCC 9006 = CALU 1027]
MTLHRILHRVSTWILPQSIVGILVATVSPALAGDAPPHWTYGGAANPSHWGELSTDYSLCEQGRDQSPINIQTPIAGSPQPLALSYGSTPLTIVNSGHSIQVNYAPGNKVKLGGEDYELLQFHFHTPSEHALDGNNAPMELHLVHSNAQGELAVVGVMIEVGDENPTIDTLWENIPPSGQTQTINGVMVNVSDLLPRNQSYYSYSGSLTTPPCSENVQWNILTETVEISEEQVEAFMGLYPVNARPLQPLNGRMVESHRR